MLRAPGLAVALLVGPVAFADPFWVEYNANVLPEQDGWSRLFESPGGSRSVNGGIFTLNTRGRPGVYDFNYRRAEVALAAGEEFLYEWRTRVTGELHDTWVNIGQGLSFAGLGVSIGETLVQVGPNNFVWIPPGVFHDYRLSSADMRDFDLFIDGALAWSFSRTSGDHAPLRRLDVRPVWHADLPQRMGLHSLRRGSGAGGRADAGDWWSGACGDAAACGV